MEATSLLAARTASLAKCDSDMVALTDAIAAISAQLAHTGTDTDTGTDTVGVGGWTPSDEILRVVESKVEMDLQEWRQGEEDRGHMEVASLQAHIDQVNSYNMKCASNSDSNSISIYVTTEMFIVLSIVCLLVNWFLVSGASHLSVASVPN